MYGPELKNLRKKTIRIRQDQFAGILGLHPTTVSDWERDKEKVVPQYAAILATVMAEDTDWRERIIDITGVAE